MNCIIKPAKIAFDMQLQPGAASKLYIIQSTINTDYVLWQVASERPKPPFWFRPDTETETVIGRYFRPKPIPKPQSSEVVINIQGG